MHGSFFWPSINKAIKEVVHQCETCTQFQSQNAAAPLTPTPTPSCPWQMCATDIFMLEGIDHLVVGDFYSKMIFVWCLPPSQSNANKVISLLKEMFSEHGIPEVLCSDNGPQYASVQFADFCTSWGISHETSSLHYPQSNGFAKACVKSVKHVLQQAKYSGADPHLALLALWATPINSKLLSPAELLYQCWPILAKICNSDPSAMQVHEQIDTCSKAVKSQADKCSKTLAPLYAGQPVATYDTLRKIWVPATVICILPQSSYLVCTSNGSTYCHTWRHLRECSVKAANTVPSGTTATLQALSSHCFLAAQPASPHLHHACSPHLLHLQCWQARWNRLQMSLPCQLFRRMPWHQSLWHPMPHLCSHEDPAMPAWHQDAWSRRSRNYWPRLSTDFDCNILPHTSPVNHV